MFLIINKHNANRISHLGTWEPSSYQILYQSTLDDDIFYRVNKMFDLLVALDEKLGDQ